MIYEMSCRFGKRPYEFLFPFLTNPNTQMAIDALVFQIGYAREKEQEADKLKLQASIAGMKSAFR